MKLPDEYHQTRNTLFLFSYIAHTLASVIRKKYDLPCTISKDHWVKILTFPTQPLPKNPPANYGIPEQDCPKYYFEVLNTNHSREIQDIVSKLNIDFQRFRDFTIMNRIPKISDKESERRRIDSLISIADEQDPITKKGVYIRFSPDMTDTDLKQAKKEADEIYDRFVGKSKYFAKKKKSKLQNLPRKFRAYVEVERRLIDIMKRNIRSGYGNDDRPVTAALQHVRDDWIDKYKPYKSEDDEYELQLLKDIERIYYEVIKTYELPKFTDLPSLLGLVTHNV